ncbi:MgtC/SapB family protein [Paracoccus jeotgali]|uniref:MgtC/SapB family protein n=1 Tax=Paracoccus jeotgali TaxID=2065379 RepID=UPI0028A99354|nr:MgtC/SapB family protein [Paracoccus jeotgali]
MIELWEFILRVAVAAGCALLIGMDRSLKDKPLGAQAYIIVATGSAALIVMTLNFSLSAVANDNSLQMDPIRLISGIVGGIGFLGGGAIIKNQDDGHLRGAASGAAIWGAGAIGIACGLGYLAEAVIIAVLVFCVLGLPGWFRKSGLAPGEGSDGDE